MQGKSRMQVGCGFWVMVVLLGGAAWPAEARMPNTLNLQNVTAARVVQTVPEVSSNEKEVEFGDFDNDGDLDVVIAVAYADFGQRRNKLYENNGGTFTEISGNPAIPGFTGTDVTRNAFFRDYDGDGWLDIIVVNDNNTGGDPGRTKIYMNNHPGDVFSHFTEEGLARLGSGTGGAACGAVSIDANQDQADDLYVGNYPGPSQDTLYFNDGNGFFTAVTSTHVPVDADYTVDVSSADMNGDGKLDLLISNDFDPNFIYYNDNLGAGGGVGDFRYTGSTQNVGLAGQGENAMEPGDFDTDSDVDVYWSNGPGGDIILRNNGNDAANKPTFTTLSSLPASVTVPTSRKATVADLNKDGRVDIFVMKEAGANSRPTVLRNTSVNGVISFVDWTPASAFPDGSVHLGWHAAVFDADGDTWDDVFLGGWTNDHLFKNVDSNEVAEEDLTAGILPGLYNGDPVAVGGSVGVSNYVLEVLSRGPSSLTGAGGEGDARRPAFAGAGDADVYTLTGVQAGAFVSVVVNGCADYTLSLLDNSGGVMATSDRGGLGIEEALQVAITAGHLSPGGTLGIQVAVNEPCDGAGCLFVDDCCDADNNGIRDDACTWCACDAGFCDLTSLTTFADMGGSFGECPPDGFANIHDANHTLACFSETNTCNDLNIDAGGSWGDCPPDGFCNIHDANHALSAFADVNPCTCPQGAAPAVEPNVVGRASIALTAAERAVRPGDLVDVYVLLDTPAADLRSYQLDVAASGGRRGHLELVDIAVESRKDYVFGARSDVFQAVSANKGQMLGGLVEDRGVRTGRPGYLATYTYRVSADAAGTFVIDIRRDEAAGDQTFLIASNIGKIEVASTTPAVVKILSGRRGRVR